MSKARIFSIKRAFGGGILPVIGVSCAAAYKDGNRIIVVPYDGEIYYSAPLTLSIDCHIKGVFEAENIVDSKLNVGSCVASIWRPGRTPRDDISVDETHNKNLRSDKQALLLLVTKLSEIFLTIEPTTNAMCTYGHKVRELHLLACMEVENYFQDFLKEGLANLPVRPTTNNYVKLAAPLYLSEYSVDLPQFPNIPNIFPFKDWNKSCPTQSLKWYDDYNKSKHNRRENFGCSTLGSTIDSVAAAVVMFTVRHGMHQLIGVTDVLSLQVSQIMRIGISSPDAASWYVPKIILNLQNSREQSAHIEGLQIWNRVALQIDA